MKTEIKYEIITDRDLSFLIGDKLGLDKIDKNPADIPYAESGYGHKPYATSLDACREAIQEFTSTECYCFHLIHDGPLEDESEEWRAVVMFGPSIDSERIEEYHQNPARAACIAILKALGENN